MITIVIVNWNANQQLAECVVSIAQYHHNLVASVVIVDNASSDNSLALVKSLPTLPFPLFVVENKENRGFAAACNQGAARAVSEYLLFLNPDTRLFESSLTVSTAFMEESKNQEVGIVGIQLIDDQNQVARSCARFPSLGMFVAQILGINRLPGFWYLNVHMSGWAHDKTAAVDHVMGAFYLMRRSLFESLGGFDERFFVYLEDLDLSLRVQQAGYHSVFLAEAKAFHAGGGTSGQVKAARLFYSLRSRLLYAFKHFSPWRAWILVLITLGVEPVTRTFFSIVSGELMGVDNTWRAYSMLWRNMRFILEKSRQ